MIEVATGKTGAKAAMISRTIVKPDSVVAAVMMAKTTLAKIKKMPTYMIDAQIRVCFFIQRVEKKQAKARSTRRSSVKRKTAVPLISSESKRGASMESGVSKEAEQISQA